MQLVVLSSQCMRHRVPIAVLSAALLAELQRARFRLRAGGTGAVIFARHRLSNGPVGSTSSSADTEAGGSRLQRVLRRSIPLRRDDLV